MVSTSIDTLDESLRMPPPRMPMRQGSTELQDAINLGHIELSLPKQDWSSWISGRVATNHRRHSYLSQNITDEVIMEETDSAIGMEVLRDGSQHVGVTQECDGTIEAATTPDGTENSHGAGASTNMVCENQDCKYTSFPFDEDSPSRVSMTMSSCDSLPRFEDIVGHAEAKLRLDEVLLPLALPRDVRLSVLSGIRSLSPSILLFGPPGCGKSQLAKAIAGEAEAAFISVSPSDVLSKYVGESEAAIRDHFRKACERASQMDSRCAVLFFDEIDAIGQSRGGRSSHSDQLSGSDSSSRRILAELLIQLNMTNTTQGGIEKKHFAEVGRNPGKITSGRVGESEKDEERPLLVIVVAATNRPEDCDPALLRRFSVRVIIALPTPRDRKKIIEKLLSGIEHTLSSREMEEVVSKTEGWSGSDLESLTREAAMAPIRECIRAAAKSKRRKPHMVDEHHTKSLKLSFDFETVEQGHQRSLLSQFKNLRPVSLKDFEDALAFISWNQGCVCDPSLRPNAGENSKKEALSHYDTRSNEDE